MKLETGTWVLVADGRHAIIFENEGTAAEPKLKKLRDYDEPQSGALSQGAAASPGPRTSHEPPDPHQAKEDRFVAQLAQDLSLAASKKAFAEIVVVASPIALGNFRKAASAELTSRVILWIHKDLTKHPVAEILKTVERALED